MDCSRARKGLSAGQYKPLNRIEVQTIANTAIRLLEEVGVRIAHNAAVKLLARAGADVDREDHLVKIPTCLVEDSVARAPSTVRLCGRDSRHDLQVGGDKVYLGTGGTALYVLDGKTGIRREATLDDLRQIARLVDALDNIDFFLIPTYPNDVDKNAVDVNRFYASISNTTKHVMGGVYTAKGVCEVVKMAEAIAGSPEALREHPLISIITCAMSPLKLDSHYTALMLEGVRAGIPVACPSEPLCGATSPVTLAGNLAIQTADSLAAVVLAQIANPGAPVIFGSVATSTDLRDMKYLSGSIEEGLINAGAAQLARYFQLPYYATAGMSDAKVLDAQCGYESALTSILTALAGANFIHDAAGLMEFALTVCPEKYVMDNEILGMVMRAVQGIQVTEEKLGFDVIRQVGPGGNFVAEEHTVRHMRDEHYVPELSDRDRREEWENKGRKTTLDRASEKVSEILETHEPLPLDSDIEQHILDVIPGIVAPEEQEVHAIA